MAEWQTVRLGEIVKTNQSTYSPKENWQFVNYLDTGNITMNKIDEIQNINTAKDKLPSRARRKVKTNSIIYSTVRPNQLHYGIIKKQPDNFLVSTGFTVIDVNYDKAVPDFIYYALTKQEVTEQLQAIAEQSVSAYPSLKPSDIENLELMLPDKKTQERIVAILRSIDEKIKENNAINNNLEQQAQALYENIFCIHSDIDTKHISLSDLMDYAGGSQPPASEFVFSERDGYIRFVQIRDYDTDSHITYIPDSPKNKLCEEHDIMIARYGASLGRICFGINGAYNVALAKVFPKKSFFREFLRCYLSSRTFYEGINNKGGRSAQAGFNQSDINSFEIDFPVDETIVKKFECTVAPMFEQRLQLKKENQHLASLRNTLLPKLMSGELDVSNVEI